MMKKAMTIFAAVFGLLIAVLLILNLITNRELVTEIEYKTSKEKVWAALTDTESYPNWNPFIVSIKGELLKGAQLSNTMVNKGKETIFNPIITDFKPMERFEWLGTGAAGMFKGRHYFELKELPNGNTKMIHGEKFAGLLSGLILQLIGKDTHANFVAMNEAMVKQIALTN